MDSRNTAQAADTGYSPVRQHNFRDATLLVVDDQEDIWTLIRLSLAKYFTDVTLHRCANRKETIVYLADCLASGAALPKLILQDLYLPRNEEGFVLLKDIRNLLSNDQQIPILVMSSSAAETDIRQAYHQGASFYIVKPQTLNGWLSLTQRLRHFWWEQGILPLGSPKGGQQTEPEGNVQPASSAAPESPTESETKFPPPAGFRSPDWPAGVRINP